MSRIGKQPVLLPEGVTIEVQEGRVEVKGPKGKVEVKVPKDIEVKGENGVVVVVGELGNLQGLVRALLNNAVVGVNQGWSKTLELTGTGYRATVASGNLHLALGFSHPVVVEAPAGIEFAVKENKITVSGVSKEMVGQIAAKIRKFRPADPYKAKGFKYEGEKIARKAGKSAKAAGAAK